MHVTIDGIGVVGGFGSGIDAFSEALARKKRCTKNRVVQSSDCPKEMPFYGADTARLDEFIPRAHLRRVDHYARMGLLAASLALKDSGEIKIDRSRLGIVIATGYGASSTTSAFLDSFIHKGEPFPSPTHFSNSVHNAAAAHISIFLKASGPCLTVSQFELSLASALLTAMTWLEEERVDVVLLGSVDEYCDLLGYCWWRFFGEWGQSPLEPFSFERQSAIPGEGAAFFLLSRPKKNEGATCHIMDVQTGNMKSERPALSEKGLLIIGADGHKQCGKYYGDFLSKRSRTVSFTPLYGSFPTNNAFDMAAAALILKKERAFVPAYVALGPGSSRSEEPFPYEDIDLVQCLKVGMERDFGVITLCRT
jgi:3-oxoacyl-[acyl-carrier-protein] synthase II